MSENVVRIIDYEKRSKQADAAQPRDPCEADVIVLPVIHRFNAEPFRVATVAEHLDSLA